MIQASCDGTTKDVLPSEYSALNQVHEYGGASFVPRDTDGHLVFTDMTSKAVPDLDPESRSVSTIVEGDSGVCFADSNAQSTNNRWVLAIQEDRHAPIYRCH